MAGSGSAHLRDANDTLLRVENLYVEFPVGRTGLKVHAVSDISIDARPGETLGLVGESGCGKSTTGKAIMQIERPTSGSIRLEDDELTTLPSEDLRQLRPKMQMIFQDPISSLNPRRKVGDIVGEPLRIWASEHNPPDGSVRLARRLLQAIAAIGLGGLALWLLFWLVDGFIPYLLNIDWYIARPAYESLLGELGTVLACAVLGAVSYSLARTTRDRAPQGRGGQIAFGVGLGAGVAALVPIDSGLARLLLGVVVALVGFGLAHLANGVADERWGTLGYAVGTALVAVTGFSTLAVFGEAIAVQTSVPEDAFELPAEAAQRAGDDGTSEVTSTIDIDGDVITVVVSLNETPVKTTEHALAGSGQAALLLGTWGAVVLSAAAGLVLLLPGTAADYRRMAGIRAEHLEIVKRTIADVGLDPDTALNRRPHQFSGGQCQRICIARALVLDPKVIICDEPVSALDVSVQAQILNLLEEMKERYDLTMVFIAHDLAVVKNISDRVVVMYLGKTCEVAPPDDLYANPAHPYTAALLASIPVPDPAVRPREETVLGGEIPSPVAPPSGCRFRTRCPKAQDRCAQSEPKMTQVGLGHYVACHFPLEATSKKPGAAQLAAKAAQG